MCVAVRLHLLCSLYISPLFQAPLSSPSLTTRKENAYIHTHTDSQRNPFRLDSEPCRASFHGKVTYIYIYTYKQLMQHIPPKPWTRNHKPLHKKATRIYVYTYTHSECNTYRLNPNIYRLDTEPKPTNHSWERYTYIYIRHVLRSQFLYVYLGGMCCISCVCGYIYIDMYASGTRTYIHTYTNRHCNIYRSNPEISHVKGTHMYIHTHTNS